MEFTLLNILLLAFLVPCIGVIGALFGLHLSTIFFGPIRINKTTTVSEP